VFFKICPTPFSFVFQYCILLLYMCIAAVWRIQSMCIYYKSVWFNNTHLNCISPPHPCLKISQFLGVTLHYITNLLSTYKIQEAQLPQRNSASAAMHGGGLDAPAHSPPPPLATPMRLVESKTRNKRTSSVPSTKRTLRWIGHSRSFKVILIGAGRNRERCVVVMCN